MRQRIVGDRPLVIRNGRQRFVGHCLGTLQMGSSKMQKMLFLSFNETSGYAQIPRLCEDPAVAEGVQSCSIVTLVYQELPERNAVLHCGWYGVR